jgi:hypothetical protein
MARDTDHEENPLRHLHAEKLRRGAGDSTVDLRSPDRAKVRQNNEVGAWEDECALWDWNHQQTLDKVKKALGTEATEARRGRRPGKNHLRGARTKAELENLDPRPLPPPSPDLTATEPTFEGLWLALRKGRPSLGVLADEGGQFLSGHAMSAENRLKSMAAFNGLWDGKPMKRMRRGDGTSTLHGRRLCSHLMVQLAVAKKFAEDGFAEAMGFMARFLICQPTSTIGGRLQASVGFFKSPWRDRTL